MDNLFPGENDAIMAEAPAASAYTSHAADTQMDVAPPTDNMDVELNADDRIVVAMKRGGYSDQEIVDELVKQGFAQLQPRTISTKYQRICQRLQEYNDELLEEDLTDWHDGEDDVLRQAYARAEQQVTTELQAIREKLFIYTSLEVNRHTDRPRFSAKACKNRLEALADGSARPPPELDPDPDARKRETAARKKAYFEHKVAELRRSAQEEEDRKNSTPSAIAKAARKAEADKKKAQLAEERAAQKAKTDARIRAETAARELREQVRREHRQEERSKAAEEVNDRRVLKILQRNYEDKIADFEAMEAEREAEDRRRSLQGYHHGVGAMSRSSLPYGSVDPSINGLQSPHIENVSCRFDSPYDPDSAQSYPPDAHTPLPQGPGYNSSFRAPSVNPRGFATPAPPHGAPRSSPTSHVLVADDPSLDPREIMAKPELMAIVIERGMSKNREKETKGLLARRLRESDRMASSAELHKWLRRRGLSTKGNKAELIWRLQEYDARTSRSWRPKHMAVLRKSRDAVRAGFGSGMQGMREGGVKLPRPGKFIEGVDYASPLGREDVRESVEGRDSLENEDGYGVGGRDDHDGRFEDEDDEHDGLVVGREREDSGLFVGGQGPRQVGYGPGSDA
ncbi:Eukaryotic translation initiation factor 4 gamma [Sphaceloma murrayae]|uniref:Eukaryotic translation initiation factor 4 gamma n=1 Tax=Sphaceloma murrayae TaxID=2082308 RepID=A0A2K1QKU3_9PEZI|nr:Eukaryotic translation initiation factor 4 gamma [Sphaceloma murrayae]